MNKSWSKYYENTKILKPSRFLTEAFKSFNPKPGLAIDLGCGAGRDTRYLLEKGFEVKAVDKDPVAKKHLNLLSHQHMLEFICADFKDFVFGRYDLVNAHYALPFTEKDSFCSVMNKVIGSIKPNGLFVGQLFGVNDEWNTPETKMTFCERKDVDKLFSNFKVVEISEVDRAGIMANGNPKHWHVFNIIAQK
jgi:SAM-dependent methyltransferase